MALQQDLIVDQGTLFEWDFLLRTDQRLIFDLTGYQVRGEVRKDYNSGTVLLTPTFAVSQALGKITMRIAPVQTSVLLFAGEETEAVYDVEIYNDTTGDVKRIVAGTMTITREVTREVV